MRFRPLLLVALLSVPSLALAQAIVSPAVQEDASRGSARVLIRLRTPAQPEGRLASPGAIADQRARIASAQDGVAATLGPDTRLRRFRAVPWAAASLTAAQVAALTRHPSVAAIHRDVPVPPALAQSVPFVGAPVFWQVGYRGTGWTVAILDTGVDALHPMIAGRLVHEACFSSNEPADSATSLCQGGAETGGGAGAAQPCPSSVAGCNHGTAVAGIAAGGSTQLSGVAPAARLASIQVYSRFNNPGLCAPRQSPCVLSYTSDQIAGLEHVLEMAGAANANQIAAANLSLSGQLFSSQSQCDIAEGMPAFKDAVDNLRAIGVATVVASGNDGASTQIGAPACVSTVVSVGGSARSSDVLYGNGNRASFLSLVAPAEAITSPVPGGGFQDFTGTSMAAPFVAGGFALLKQVFPAASVTTLLTALRGSGILIPDSTGEQYPRIRLVSAALAVPGGVMQLPGAPQNPELVVAGNIVGFLWTPPLTGNGPTRYVVTAGSNPGATDIGTFNVGLATSISAAVGPGTYHVRVRAENYGGPGPATADQMFTIEAPEAPDAPSMLNANVVGRAVTLTWQAPTAGGVPTSYVIEVGSVTGGSELLVYDTQATVLGLHVGNVAPAKYYVRVRAKNAVGVSTATSNEVIVQINP